MTHNTPLVSVIVTCYNYAEYVEEAIRSVQEQTYQNIELIVINDGSTDGSDQVIERLQKKYKFQYINKENEGIIKTRNQGVSLAKGNFQLQLDADDILESTYVEKCVSAAIRHGADIVYTQVRVFGRAEFESSHIDYDLEKLKHDNYIHATALVRSSVLPENPYDIYLNDKGNEDWDLFLGLCLDGAKAKLVNEPLLLYRKHEDMRSRSDKFEGTINEALVRHHIWSKQNAKHPEEFWYFSSQIDLLYKVIKAYEDFSRKEGEMENIIKELEFRTPREDARKLINKLRAMVK